MEILGDPNERSMVTAENNKVCKQFLSTTSYENEKKCYMLLEGQSFVPKIYEYNDEKKYIIMERINGKSIYDGAEIPPTFIEDMLIIYDKLVKRGIIETTDLFKSEHIFVDPDNSKETHGIRIIDFDISSPINPDNPAFNAIISIAKNRRDNIVEEIKQMLLENGIKLSEE